MIGPTFTKHKFIIFIIEWPNPLNENNTVAVQLFQSLWLKQDSYWITYNHVLICKFVAILILSHMQV